MLAVYSMVYVAITVYTMVHMVVIVYTIGYVVITVYTMGVYSDYSVYYGCIWCLQSTILVYMVIIVYIMGVYCVYRLYIDSYSITVLHVWYLRCITCLLHV